MSDERNNKVIEIKRTYCAKLFRQCASGFEFTISGTLDGGIDLAITGSGDSHLTYNISPAEAIVLAGNLEKAAWDVHENCLFDGDALLERDSEKNSECDCECGGKQ